MRHFRHTSSALASSGDRETLSWDIHYFCVPRVAGAGPELETLAARGQRWQSCRGNAVHLQFESLWRFPMNEFNAAKEQLVGLTADEVLRVSGGVEKEGLYPRKFGDVDYQVYVDGALIGTTYGPASPVSPDVGSADRSIPPRTDDHDA